MIAVIRSFFFGAYFLASIQYYLSRKQYVVADYPYRIYRSSVYLAQSFPIIHTSLVHSSTSVELFHDSGDLIEEPGLGGFVWDDGEFVVLFSEAVSEADSVVLCCNALDLGEREFPV